jgi:hypothetical protein
MVNLARGGFFWWIFLVDFSSSILDKKDFVQKVAHTAFTLQSCGHVQIFFSDITVTFFTYIIDGYKNAAYDSLQVNTWPVQKCYVKQL